MREIKFRLWDKEENEYVYPNDKDSNNSLIRSWTDSEDETSCMEQFTGLRDKNGKEIYEGDIVSHYACGVAKITFSEDAGGFMIGDGRFDWHWASEIAVIDNIHENPELLK